MCTAAAYRPGEFYFGRTLDDKHSLGEEVAVLPRNAPLPFRHMGVMNRHYAIIGMAYCAGEQPLYYDAVNEKGLGMAGLNFIHNAYYRDFAREKNNVAHFELIPWVLSQCADVREAKALLEKVNLTPTPFHPGMPAAQLHWMIADREDALTVEAVKEGLRVYPNPVGILTNDPPFDQQMLHLSSYMHLSPKPPRNLFSSRLDLHPHSSGAGALGLPGDFSSRSRFVRAAFAKLNAVSGPSEQECVSQFFHILGTVQQPRGCNDTGDGDFITTIYTSCCNAGKGIYYYTTYDNRQISAVSLHRTNLEGTRPVRYPLLRKAEVRMQN